MNISLEINFKKKTLRLKAWQYLTHYYIVALILLIYLPIALKSVEGMELLLFLSLGLISYFFQSRLLKFKEFKVRCTQEDLLKATERSAQSLDWTIISTEGIILAFDRELSAGGSDTGYMIIIAKTKDGFLFNSLNSLNYPAFPFIKPLYHLNQSTFIKHLKDVLNEVNYNENFESTQKEWSLRKILIRLFLYPICLLIYGVLGIFIWNWQEIPPFGILSIIGGAITTSFYLYYDIKGIRQNRKKTKS